MTCAVDAGFHAVMTPAPGTAFATAGPGEAPCIDCGAGPAQACTGCTRDLILRAFTPKRRPGHRDVHPVCILCELEAAARCAVCLMHAIQTGRAQIARTAAGPGQDPDAALTARLTELDTLLNSAAPAPPGHPAT
jgi:hypothetical protein